MIKPGETAYFVFRGDWVHGMYNGHFCLPNGYYPFMPIEIKNCERELFTVDLHIGNRWILSMGCIEKEFSIEKFVLAQLEWGKKVTLEQFKSIMATLKDG